MDLLKETVCTVQGTLRQGVGNSATGQFSKSGTMTKRSRRARPIATPGSILAPPIVRHLVRESPPRECQQRASSPLLSLTSHSRVSFSLLPGLIASQRNWLGFAICSLASLLLVYELIGSRGSRRSSPGSLSIDRLAVKDEVTQRDWPLENSRMRSEG